MTFVYNLKEFQPLASRKARRNQNRLTPQKACLLETAWIMR